jgi:hypothetical protein
MPVANEYRAATNGESHSRNCGCGECLYGPFTRNHYFTGKLLVERDFKDEQLYYMEKHLMHQQRLHGEGVVCGLQVVQYENPNCRDRFVCIEPGLAIDCCGHDILVKRRECIDITQFDAYKKLAQTAGRLPHSIQICIRYRECPTEEVPVLYDECGCDSSACAPNRILESYDFDLIVDPVLKTKVHCVPTLNFKAQLPIAGGGTIAVHNAVFVLAPNLRTVTKFDLAGTTVQDNLTLPGDGRALSLSEDGKTLYLVGDDASPATKTELWAIDTTVPLALPTAAATVAAAPASGVELRTVPSMPGLLLSLNNATGELIVWDVTASPATKKKSIALAVNAKSLVAGNKGLRAYAIDPAAKVIQVVDLTTSAKTSITLLAQPSLLKLANSSAPDILFVTNGVGPSANALKVDTPKILGTQPLSVLPSTVVLSPDFQFAYLAMTESSVTTLRPLDVDRLISGAPEPPGDGSVVQLPLAEPAISPDGLTIFYPEINSTTQASDVEVLTVSPHVCPDLYEVADCPQCDQPDCIVLATLQNYNPGFQMEGLPGEAGDFAAHIARIDNRLGRQILPSTQKIAEVLECLLECNKGGIPGPKGDTGSDGQPGKNGDPGLGLNVNLPKIIDIGWKHGDSIAWDDFRNLYDSTSALDKIRRTPKIAPLVLYFNEVMQGVDRQTFRVSLSYPQRGNKALFSGLFNPFKLDLCGDIVDLGPGLGPGLKTPHTAEPYASAWAFIPQPELFEDTLPQALIGPAWNVFLKTQRPIDLPCLRIELSGDFVFSPNLATGSYDESRMLDANNIGGQVGLVRTRGTPFPAAPMNPSGDLVEGGDFQGWFFFKPPKESFGAQRINLNELFFASAAPVQINQASLADLQALPGISPALAKKIIRERDSRRFTDIADFKSRAGLDAATMDQLSPEIVID